MKQYQLSLCGLRLTLFTTCYLQPDKIPSLCIYNAFDSLPTWIQNSSKWIWRVYIPVTGSERATLWVEKSGWCCLQPAVYNLLRFMHCLPCLPGFILWKQPARCIATLQSNITAILKSVINLSLEAENMAMVPTCGSLLQSSHVELHVYMERNYLTWYFI